MAELLRPDALRIPDLQRESLVVVREDDALGAIGATGDRPRLILAGRQFRGALYGAALDHDSIVGTRLDFETGVALRKWRPEPRRAGHTLPGFHDMISPDERDRPTLSPDLFRSFLNVLAVLRA